MFIDAGLLVIRVVLGAIFVAHGAQKLFGWFGGGGLKGTTAWIGNMGIRPAWLWGTISALNEFGGGLLLIAGLANPLGPLAIIAQMLVATLLVHWRNGFWNSKGGIEFPLINLAGALLIGLSGSGAYSLDAILKLALPEPITLAAGLVAVVLGTAVALLTRVPPQQTPRPATGR